MPQFRILLCWIRFLLVLAGSYLLVTPAPGSTTATPAATRITGAPWAGERGVAVTMEQIQEWDRRNTNRVPYTKRAIVLEHVASAPANGSAPEYMTPILNPGLLTNSQMVGTVNFTAATLPDCSGYPPDTMGTAGPSQFVIALNGRIRSFNKSTGVADGGINAATDSFFSSVMTPTSPGKNSTSDPRIRFDRLSGRWFVSMIDVPGNNAALPNRIMLAMSSSGVIQANTAWTFFQFQHDLVGPTPNVDTGQFADYPTLAVDANALYLGVNVFSTAGGFLNTTVYVVRKASLISGGPIVVTAFRGLITAGSGIFTPHGADNYDSTAAEGYIAGVDRIDRTALRLLRIATPGGTPTISEYLSIPIDTYSPPILVPNLGNASTNGYLDCVDYRLMAAHYRDGLLWTCHNVGINNTGGVSSVTRDGVQWFAITNIPTGAAPIVSQSGLVYQATSTNSTTARSYWMGTIVASGQGHATMGFSSSASGEFINAATTGRLVGDPPGTMQAPFLYTHSVTVYNPAGDTGGSRGRRWGDYSYTSVDPSDDMTMWTIQEFCSGSGIYGVRVAKLLAPPTPLPTNCAPANLSQGSTNVTVVITGAADTNGSGFFDPGPGFSNRLTLAASGNGITINSLTYNNPTTITAVITVAGNAQVGARTWKVTNPDGQFLTSTNPLLTIQPGLYNNPPVLAAIPNHTVPVGTTLSFTNAATDPESPPETLTFSLGPGAPATASLDASTGAFTWTPDASQIGTNTLSVVVTDNGSPFQSATQSFSVIVVLTNHPPVVSSIPNQFLALGTSLALTSTATDPDSPPSSLSFSLTAGSPFNAAINPTNGVFTWTPAPVHVGTNTVGIVASDDGLPPLSGTNFFQVKVVQRPVMQSVVYSNLAAVITWSSMTGQSYRLQFKSNLADLVWNDLAPDVIADGSSTRGTDTTGSQAQRFYRVQILP
jgi:hypothetical protein